jgi:4-hydroxy-4-methyl-2-oxoglutarate aldolase
MERMIKDPPLLTIRRDFERPIADEMAAFAGVPTGYAIDAMGGRGALDYRIKPLAPATSVMVGVAITCHCGPADNLALFGALAVAKPGDVLVAATDGFTATSVAGDLLMGMARNRGLLGLVTDGLARDVAGIVAVGLPVFCAGLTPNSPVRNGPGTVGLPVVVGGVAVEPGDIVIADNDGVVIVPRSQAKTVIKRLPDVRTAEAGLEAKVKAGLEIPDFIRSVLASDRVTEV